MCNQSIDDIMESTDDNTAKDHYKKCQFRDPLPSIQPALLNHVDIKRYIHATGMISPYYKKNMTNATYKVPLAGDVYWWEENERGSKERKSIHIKSDDTKTEVILKKNSITYFHISTIFRVPYYLVFRFNLTVSLAHKGLLLGTGPIVDPGFEGRIMIPVHNLTANDYTLTAGDSLIRIEFTKLSSHPTFNTNEEFNEPYRFPEVGKYWDAAKYFENINGTNPIVSSIPEAVAKANEAANQANKKAIETEDHINTIKKIAWGAAGISVFTIVVGIVAPTWNMINDTNIASKEFVKNDEVLKKLLEKQEDKIKDLEKIIENLSKQSHETN